MINTEGIEFMLALWPSLQKQDCLHMKLGNAALTAIRVRMA